MQSTAFSDNLVMHLWEDGVMCTSSRTIIQDPLGHSSFFVWFMECLLPDFNLWLMHAHVFIHLSVSLNHRRRKMTIRDFKQTHKLMFF